jgi:hypothetical protein
MYSLLTLLAGANILFFCIIVRLDIRSRYASCRGHCARYAHYRSRPSQVGRKLGESRVILSICVPIGGPVLEF